MARTEPDAVDRIVEQWRQVRPDVDVAPIQVVGRLSRLSRIIDRQLAENFATFGIENWMYDMLATLRRAGAPYSLTAGELVGQSMVTTGAITNRIDRLEARGLVERTTVTDRRKVVVRLTPAGLSLVDEIVEAHVAFEESLLRSLAPNERKALAGVLRTLLLSLGDRPTPT